MTIGSFNGGGTIILPENQTLTINGNVENTTNVAIGNISTNGNNSQSVPQKNHTYIKAQGSSQDSFKLLPYVNNLDVKFQKDENGNWTVA
ncbi:hypothetical protein, partial [Paraclostridium bifermentans]|uniref:hypothetical protein n=1 Tax=Paraclostridium bifermentans TaxID=1490 RepID=UPI0024311D5C